VSRGLARASHEAATSRGGGHGLAVSRGRRTRRRRRRRTRRSGRDETDDSVLPTGASKEEESRSHVIVREANPKQMSHQKVSTLCSF